MKNSNQDRDLSIRRPQYPKHETRLARPSDAKIIGYTPVYSSLDAEEPASSAPSAPWYEHSALNIVVGASLLLTLFWIVGSKVTEGDRLREARQQLHQSQATQNQLAQELEALKAEQARIQNCINGGK